MSVHPQFSDEDHALVDDLKATDEGRSEPIPNKQPLAPKGDPLFRDFPDDDRALQGSQRPKSCKRRPYRCGEPTDCFIKAKIAFKRHIFEPTNEIDHRFQHRKATCGSASQGRCLLAETAGDARRMNSGARDPNDVVAQVLNYSSFGNNDGSGGAYWYQDKSDKCKYKLFDPTPVGSPEIDLNAIDPRNIMFREELTDSGVTYTILQYDTHPLLPGASSYFLKLDVQRLQRGWSLIYSKYCSGKKHVS